MTSFGPTHQFMRALQLDDQTAQRLVLELQRQGMDLKGLCLYDINIQRRVHAALERIK